MFSLSACASCSTEREEPMENESEKNEQESTPDQKPQTPSDNDVLVAYFSCTNTTKAIAEDVASITGGTLFRIEPEQPYSSADLNYNSDCRANREQNDPKSRPAIKHQIKDLDKYGIVFIGYPIWWGEAPRIMCTFLESGDFKGKTIIPFCTSHSSGIGSSDVNLHSLVSEADWKPGKRFSIGTNKKEIENWVNSLNLNIKEQNNDMDYSKFPLEDGKTDRLPLYALAADMICR